jgi:hypothetical protein
VLADAATEAIDGAEELGQNLLLVDVTVTAGAYNTPSDMVFQNQEPRLASRGDDGRELGQDIQAVLVLIDHALHTAYLAFHPAQPCQNLGLVMRVRCGTPPLGFSVRVDRFLICFAVEEWFGGWRLFFRIHGI